MNKFLIPSLTIHALIMLGLYIKQPTEGGKGQGGGDAATQPQHKGDITSPTPIQIIEVPPKIANPKLPGKAKPKPIKQECSDWYGGIGVTIDPLTNIIRIVHPGYPAERAGLQKGDLILATSDEIIGTVGTQVVVVIERGADQYRVTMYREKICTDGK
jgi:S1-C subfamily serine protease